MALPESSTPSAPAATGPGNTRERLVQAGLEVFGRHGFDGANTRQIARHAGVNLAAIPYHFGGKAGLYRAVAEHIADRMSAVLDPALERIQAGLDDPALSRDEVIARLRTLVSAFAGAALGAGADDWAPFVMREQIDPGEGFDVIYRRILVRVHGAYARLVGRLLDKPADDPEILLRAFTAVGQVLVFRVARAGVLRRMGWRGYSPDQVRDIQRIVADQVEASFSPPGGLAP